MAAASARRRGWRRSWTGNSMAGRLVCIAGFQALLVYSLHIDMSVGNS
ncbi:hypothetical protein CBM2637_B100153 [Cupriavidus taiwanensis]|nr:hypothetical protein CBM2637_B100153 [Cupriavidus taiwanensis]